MPSYMHAHMYMQNKEINVIKQETGEQGMESQGSQHLLPAKYQMDPCHGFHCEDKGDSGVAKAGSNQGLRFSLISSHYCRDGTG